MKAIIRENMPGWRLVDHQVYYGLPDDSDPVWLMQDENTYSCALAFTGTNCFSELFTSTNILPEAYCGFDWIHAGFKEELWTLTKNLFPTLKPKLGKCSKVICVGHSLGGSLCDLFAACANSGRTGDPDYELLKWTKGKSELMPEFK